MLYKRLSIILLLIFCMQSLPSVAQDKLFEVSEFGDKAFLLMDFGIVDRNETNKAYAEITRAEFIALAVKAMGMETAAELSGHSNIFSDISKSHWAAGYINFAYHSNLNLASWATGSEFKPDLPVLFHEALYTAVAMTGYAPIAEHSGGFPAGYIKIANQNGLLSGLSLSSRNIFRGEAYILMHNALHTDIVIPTSVSGQTNFKISKGSDILSYYHGIYHDEGIVTATYYAATKSVPMLKKSEITVNSEVFEFDEQKSPYLLGKNIVYYYKDDNTELKKIKTVRERGNSEIIISAKDIQSYSDNAYIVNAERKELKFTLSMQAEFVYNNNLMDTLDLELLVPQTGSVTLIDNNRDDVYDVVIINEYYNLVVNRVDASRNRIFDIDISATVSKTGQSRNLFLDDYSIFEITDSAGKTVAISDIKQNSVLSVCKNQYNRIVTAIVQNNKVSGTIDEVDFDSKRVVVSNREYTVSDDARFNHNILNHYTLYTFHLNYRGEIVYYVTGELSNFGYVLKAAPKQGLGNNIEVKMLNTFGEVIHKTFASKVTLVTKDPTMDASISERVDGERLLHEFSQRVMISFASDSNGEINKVVLPYAAATETDYKNNINYPLIEMKYMMDTWPSSLKTNNRAHFKREITGFSNWLILNESSTVFVVPELSIFDFSDNDVLATGVGYFTHDATIEIDNLVAYKTNRDSFGADILINYAKAVSNPAERIPTDNAVSLVKAVSKAINPSTEQETYKVVLSTNGSENTLYTYDESVIEVNGAKIGKGDVVRYSTKINGDIDGFQHIYSLVDNSMKMADNGWNSQFRVAKGVAETFKDNRLIWTLGSGTKEYTNISGVKVSVYDMVRNMAYEGKISDITEGDTIIIHSRYAKNNSIIVYKGGSNQ